MRVFLAGATGAIGRRLVPLLLRAGHDVTGITRSAQKGRELERAGVAAVVLDVFDAQATRAALRAAKPEAVIHQLNDLPREFDEARIAAAYSVHARCPREATRNPVAPPQATSGHRLVVQRLALGYATA